MKIYSVDEAKKLLEHYCAYRERSHFEVENKLREMRLIAEARDVILMHLLKKDFLNEERFARSYVRGKFRIKKWGRQKIIQGLKQHRIHQNLIRIALSEIDSGEYYVAISELIQKKKREYNIADKFLLKQKIIRYLQQKGYKYGEFSDEINLALDFD